MSLFTCCYPVPVCPGWLSGSLCLQSNGWNCRKYFFFGENSQKCHFTCHKPSFLGFPSHSQVCLIQTDSTALLRARCEHRSAVQPWPIFAPWCLIFHSCKTGIGILITFKNFNEYYCTRALILAKSWPCFRIQCCSSKTSTDGGEAPASLPLWVVLGCY